MSLSPHKIGKLGNPVSSSSFSKFSEEKPSVEGLIHQVSREASAKVFPSLPILNCRLGPEKNFASDKNIKRDVSHTFTVAELKQARREVTGRPLTFRYPSTDGLKQVTRPETKLSALINQMPSFEEPYSNLNIAREAATMQPVP